MKKSTLLALFAVIIVIAGIVWYGRGSSTSENPTIITGTPDPKSISSTTVTAPVAVTGTSKVSSKTLKYENAELGFAVNYPSAWEADSTNTGVVFIIPIDSTQVSTIAKLQSNVEIMSGKCTFPAVTTIKDRGTITVGNSTLNMITMSNSVQGRSYFDRMYSLQQGGVCYMFQFSSIALSPEGKGLTGSNITQAQNNNKALVNSADEDFTTMVKSFTLVQSPAGQDETKVAPVKK